MRVHYIYLEQLKYKKCYNGLRAWETWRENSEEMGGLGQSCFAWRGHLAFPKYTRFQQFARTEDLHK